MNTVAPMNAYDFPHRWTIAAGDDTGMTDEEKRRDQLTAAPNATESDADPRIDVTHHDGVTRIDIRDDAEVRPGEPTKDPTEDPTKDPGK